MWSQFTNVTDGRTDRQTTCDRNTVLCTKVHRAVKKLPPKLRDSFATVWFIEAYKTDWFELVAATTQKCDRIIFTSQFRHMDNLLLSVDWVNSACTQHSQSSHCLTLHDRPTSVYIKKNIMADLLFRDIILANIWHPVLFAWCRCSGAWLSAR